jgi:hypothetical protein
MLPSSQEASPSNTLSRGMRTAREIGRLHLCDRSAAKENRPEKGGGKMRPVLGADWIATARGRLEGRPSPPPMPY